MNTTPLYRFVKASERLPETEGYYHIKGDAMYAYFHKDKYGERWTDKDINTPNVEYWLEEIPYPSTDDALVRESEQQFPDRTYPYTGSTVYPSKTAIKLRAAYIKGIQLERARAKEIILDAIQYGFKYALESQHDGVDVPEGNKLQWLQWYTGQPQERAKGTQERDICKKCGGLGYVMDETTSIDCDNCGGVGRLPEFLISPQPTKVTTETSEQILERHYKNHSRRIAFPEKIYTAMEDYADQFKTPSVPVSMPVDGGMEFAKVNGYSFDSSLRYESQEHNKELDRLLDLHFPDWQHHVTTMEFNTENEFRISIVELMMLLRISETTISRLQTKLKS